VDIQPTAAGVNDIHGTLLGASHEADTAGEAGAR
jgi:hypothetical protein